MPEPRNDPDARCRRILYRASHRGTKELDWLLGKYAEAHIADMNEADLQSFEEFLALPDPDIQRWLLEPGTPPPNGEAGELVSRLKAFHEL